MALQKSVTSQQGVSADYHRIQLVSLYLDDSRVLIELSLYKDAAARAGGSRPLETKEYSVSGSDFTTYFAPEVLDVVNQNPQERAYEWLKTQTTPVDFTTGTTDV
jgi:hypothetical protein